MKDLWKILALGIVSAVLIWVWILDLDPEPSMALGVIIIVPIVFAINLAIAGILFFIGKKEYIKYFLINSLASSLLVVFLFEKGVNRNLDRRIDEWKFTDSEIVHTVYIWTETEDFNIDQELSSSMSKGYISGNYKLIKDGWQLTTRNDSIKMIIRNNELINFNNNNDTIHLERIR